jgi:hypothetical protein
MQQDIEVCPTSDHCASLLGPPLHVSMHALKMWPTEEQLTGKKLKQHIAHGEFIQRASETACH